jgi:hypothetical protein
MSDQFAHPSLAALVKILDVPLPRQAAHRDLDFARSLAIWMLESSGPWPDQIAGLLEELLALHRREGAGSLPEPAEWQQVRRKTLLVGDGQSLLVQRLMEVAEAAAWPITTGRAALTELFKAVGIVLALRAAQATGWTDEDDGRAFSLLEELADGNGATPPSREEIPILFARVAPELEQRFLRQLRASNEAFTQFRYAVIKQIGLEDA